MNTLVCLKQVPDTVEVKLNADFTLERDFIAQVMNPADESALELGLALRDINGGTVTVLTMGPERTGGMLREALARGADKAVQLTDSRFAGSDTLATATALQAAVQALGGFDLILCGRRAVDGETGQVGPMLASLLNMACVSNAVDVHTEGDTVSVDRLTEEGTETWQGTLPTVVTLCEWSHRLRLPTLRGLRQAGHADILRLSPDDLALQPDQTGLRGSPTRVVRVSARPTGVRPCVKLTVDELLNRGVLP